MKGEKEGRREKSTNGTIGNGMQNHECDPGTEILLLHKRRQIMMGRQRESKSGYKPS